MTKAPLIIEFVAGTKIEREADFVPRLPILQNGPPGTKVRFGDGSKVPLPTHQIVTADDAGGAARVGFGGMCFEGLEEGRLVFYRVKDLHPEELLSPERSKKMTLEPHMVASVMVDGRQAWPRPRVISTPSIT